MRKKYDPDMVQLFSHMLTRAVGIAGDVQPYIRELTCCAGDIYIICSDGLSNALDPGEMLAAVLQYTPGEACRKCIDLANKRGGDDNITIIVIKTSD